MFWGWFHKHLIGYKVYFIVFSSQNSAHLWTYLFGWVLFPLPFVLFLKNWKVKVTQSCLTLCDPMDYSLPSSSIHGILQARVLEWVAISFSRGSSWPGDWTQVSCIAGRFLYPTYFTPYNHLDFHPLVHSFYYFPPHLTSGNRFSKVKNLYVSMPSFSPNPGIEAASPGEHLVWGIRG